MPCDADAVGDVPAASLEALEVLDVLPPKSAISLLKAVFKSARAPEDRLEGAPAAAELLLTIWLLLNSLIRLRNSAAIPD